jgi:hypothetical protein
MLVNEAASNSNDIFSIAVILKQVLSYIGPGHGSSLQRSADGGSRSTKRLLQSVSLLFPRTSSTVAPDLSNVALD